MPKLSKRDAKNIIVAMRFSGSDTAKHYACCCGWYVEKLLEHISLSYEIVQELVAGSYHEIEGACGEIFLNGWMSPDGDFIYVPYAKHEQTAFEITGYKDCDTACANDWVKFTLGHPHNYEADHLFDAGENKTRFTPAQVTWINRWLTELAGEEIVLVL